MCRPRTHRRRWVLRSLAGLGAGAGCRAGTDPTFTVPESALTDEVIQVELGGLSPGTTVLFRARSRSQNPRFGGPWEARARFEADESGTISMAEAPAREGTYRGVEPMGLFWSMRPTGTGPGRLPPPALFVPETTGYEVQFTAEAGGESVATATTTRRLFDPRIARAPVEDAGLAGAFFAPPGEGPVPAVVHLHGAGGRPHLATARLLASRGIATLALQYFGEPGPVPDHLVEVPVEYVSRAIGWLRRRDRIKGAVGLVGFSRGGELALLAGSRLDVGAVVGWVPSGIVWEGLEERRQPAGTSAWSVDGEPVPFLELAEANPKGPPTPSLPYYEPALERASEERLAAVSVPVEWTDAPILLVSAGDDRRWPSATLAGRVAARLDAAGYAHMVRHQRNPGAGHYLRLPYLPTAGTTRDVRNVYGGSQVANAEANATAWAETLSFLRRELGG
jgi:nucleolar protein 56